MESHPLLQGIFPTSRCLRTRKPGSSFAGWFWLRIARELQSGCQPGLASLSAGLKACLGLASPLPNSLTCRITHDASLPGNEEDSQDMGFSALKAGWLQANQGKLITLFLWLLKRELRFLIWASQ